MNVREKLRNDSEREKSKKTIFFIVLLVLSNKKLSYFVLQVWLFAKKLFCLVNWVKSLNMNQTKRKQGKNINFDCLLLFIYFDRKQKPIQSIYTYIT